MKRFHVHVAVKDLDKSIDFYTKLFGQAPAKQKDDYAKWMLDDPRINFAISNRSTTTGLDHFGFQVDDEQALTQLKMQAREAGTAILDEGSTQCCYARSEKHWTVDPQGLAWEHFVTMADAVEFGTDRATEAAATTREQTNDAGTNACCG